jgi:hypothetical protein
MPEDPARQDALERATRMADRLISTDSPLLQQFGEHMRNTLVEMSETTTTAEIEDVIATVMRLGEGYDLELED